MNIEYHVLTCSVMTTGKLCGGVGGGVGSAVGMLEVVTSVYSVTFTWADPWLPPLPSSRFRTTQFSEVKNC